jgi:hypothetical protein
MATPRTFSQINTQDRDLQLIQANIERAVSSVIKAAILNGRLITGQALIAGNTQIEHKLTRTPVGYMIVDSNAAVTIFTSSKDTNFLTLNSSGAATVSIWVF